MRVAAMLLRARRRHADRWRAVSAALDRERRSDGADGAASLEDLTVSRNGHLDAV